MKKHNIAKKGNKALSMLLSLIMVLSVATPAITMLSVPAAAATAGADEAYATIFTASDFQSGDYTTKYRKLLEQVREDIGVETPDGFFFGGDYYNSGNATDPTNHIELLTGIVNDNYPYYNSDNLVFVKGNHDLISPSLKSTGLHEFEDYLVYVVNEADLEAGNEADAKALAENLTLTFDRLLSLGEDRPVFVITHVPIHHNSRGEYSQSRYGRYVFDVLNTYGHFLDIIFMYGHNHSGNYDDYLGGSVNFLGKGDTIYIAKSGEDFKETGYTAETLNFTYMNYGYAAYSNNTEGPVTNPYTNETVTSTNVVNMGVLKIYPDEIVVSRYTLDGKYPVTETIERVTPINEDGSYDTPYVNLAGYEGGLVGSSSAAIANANGFEDPVYNWSSDNDAAAHITANGSVAQVAHNATGEAHITVTVTEKDNPSISATATHTYTVSDAIPGDTYAQIRLAVTSVDQKTLEFYNTEYGTQLPLVGCYENAHGTVTTAWSSSNENVATVENGLVTFKSFGTARITFTIADANGSATTNGAYTSYVDLVISDGDKLEFKYVQVVPSTFTAGKSYIFGSTYGHTQIFNDQFEVNIESDQIEPKYVFSGTRVGFEGESGSYWFTYADSSYVWKSVATSTAEKYNLQNAQTGLYLNVNRARYKDLSYSSDYGTVATSTENTAASALWYYDSAVGSLKVDNFYPYPRSNTIEMTNRTDRILEFLLFEQVAPETEAHIEMGGEYVEGGAKAAYSVTDETMIPLYGRYKNFGDGVVESWTSSNPSVATIDENGVVDFKGTSGSTEITYTVKSNNAEAKTVTFTLNAKTGSEAKRTFKYVEKAQPNKRYVIVYKNDVSAGEGYALSTVALSDTQLYPEIVDVKNNQIKNYIYLEINESDSNELVWVTTSGPTASENDTKINSHYFCTEETANYDETTGEYSFDANTRFLGAKITGYGEYGITGNLYTVLYGNVNLETDVLTPFQFVYTSPGMYNLYKANVLSDYGSYDGYTGIRYHSSNYFGVSTVKDANVMLFEEIDPEPTAVINSNYRYIGESVSREEVCPDQTEQLTAEALDFPEGEKTYTWESSNTEVATIDQNGKITYTGKPGITTISLTITNTSDVTGITTDTRTVNITVNPSLIVDDGNKYYLTTTFVPGNEYVLAHTNTAQSDDSKNDGLVYTISSGLYNNNVAKADRNDISDDGRRYIENPTATSVWKAVDSGVNGYVYLVDNNGNYLAIYYDSGSEDVVRSFPSREGQYSAGIDINNNGTITEVEPVPIDEESFLIRTDGTYLYSKQSGTRGVNFNYGSSATAVKRFSVSSGTMKFEIFGKSINSSASTNYVYYLTDSFVPGEKYIIFAKNDLDDINGALTDKAINQMLTSNAGDKNTLLGQSAMAETDENGEEFIRTDAQSAVWECLATDVDGYYYLKNVGNGGYLTINDSNDTGGRFLGTVTTPGSLYNEGSSKIQYSKYQGSGIKVLSSQRSYSGTDYFKTGDEFIKWNGSAFAASTTWPAGTNQFLIYQAREVAGGEDEAIVPTIQIRKNGLYGSEDITSTIFNRYNISEGDTETLLRYVVNVNDGYIYKWSVDDESIATIDQNGKITYTGTEGYVNAYLTVTGTDSNGDDYSETVSTLVRVFNGGYSVSTDDYPDYPFEGSVRVNKTASNVIGTSDGDQNFQYTGVSEVELAVTGVPVDQPVDVVIVLDHSSSMNNGTMLQDAIDNTLDFSLQILNDNPNNRVAVVTFDSMGTRYSSITATSITNSLNEAECGIITGDGTAEGAFISAGEEDQMVEQLNTLITNNVGNTNYDYGLQKAYDILKYAKDNESPNNPIVVFMSDGEPNQFNGLQIDQNTDYFDAWIEGDETNEALASYLGAGPETYPAVALYNADGDNWYSKALKTPAGEPTNLPAYYSGYQTGLGAKIFTIGYKAGDTYGALGRIASTPANFYYASTNLQAAYDSILEQILNAANNAVVTDKMGSKFDLQFATSYKVDEGNTEITLAPAPMIEVGGWTLNKAGERAEYNVYETITFTTDGNGNLTGASSSVLGDGVYDVANSKIVGQYVTYDLITETFTWNIGDITRDEITLKYYVYLEGYAEGLTTPGSYDTNDNAVLDYTNFRGTDCQQTFPVPTVAYRQAAIHYDFYLVNNNGQPVNRSGMVVPFAERILIGNEQTKPVYLSSEDFTYTLNAKDVIPSGYTLYNEEACFSIKSEDEVIISASISDDKAPVTTYYREGTNAYQGTVPGGEGVHYFNTHVSFAVVYEAGIVPDTVVIDYGLPVSITVLANDLNVTSGTLNAIGTGVMDGTVLNTTGYNDRRLTGTDDTDTLTLANGTAQIDGDKIVYTPASTNYTKEEVFYYEYQTTDSKGETVYYYTTVTVIPATSIYFEESMFKFTDSTVKKNGDTYEYKWEDVGTTIEGRFQSEDRPGTFTFADADANNVYGTDSAYNDSTTYSMGSAKYVEVDKNSINNEPAAEFTFTGTGFDLFSVTDNKSGAIRVFIYSDTDGDGDVQDETKYDKNYVVNTYYGYEYNAETGEYTPVENGAAVFQVPVFRLRDFDYGTYRIVVKPMYSSAFDVTKAGSYGIYVDSVRIFDPMGTETELENKEVVKDAYKADGEYAPNYLELRDTILDKDENDSIIEGGTYENSSLFFDGSDGNDVVNYKEVGPKNEVYLGKGQAIVFGISASSNLNISSLQIGMKLISNSGDATVTVMNAEQKQPATITLTSATEQFYKLDSVVVWDQKKIKAPGEDSVYETLYPIVITNTSENDDVVISLTSLKWGYTDDIETGSNLNLFVDENTRSLAYAAMQRIADNNNEPQIDPLDKENVVVNFTDEPYTEGDSAKLTVTTEQQITRVTVDGVDLTECEIDENGKKCWTYTFDADKAGENNFVVVVYDYEGNPSETIVAQTVILDKPEDVTNNDAGDNNGSDNSDSNIIVGTDTFANNLLRMIFALIEKILSILGGGLA